MRLFFVQLGWEFRKLWARPRSWIGFAGCLLWILAGSVLLRIPDVRLAIQRDVWKMQWDFDQVSSGLTTATHLLGEAMTLLGALALTLVASDILAGEADDGSLRTMFCRPISRGRVLLLKLIAVCSHAILLTAFVAAAALGVGLLFEGPGPLVMIATHENILGTFDFRTGLERYLLAATLLAFSSISGTLVGFTVACFPMKPAAAAALTLAICFTDNIVRAQPRFASVSQYCYTTRIIAWRQVFNQEVPVSRIMRLYRQLIAIDAGLLCLAFVAIRRRPLK